MNHYFSWQRLSALTLKESKQIMRDPSAIMIAVIFPIVLIIIFAYGVNLEAQRLYLGIMVQEASDDTHDFLRAVEGSHFIVSMISNDFNQLAQHLRLGKLDAILVLPQTFSKDLMAFNTTTVQLITNGSMPNTAQFATQYVQGLWQTWAVQRHETLPSLIVSRYWFNQAANSQQSLLSGAFAIIMTIVGAFLTSLVVAKEWERGTMEALLSTPISRIEFLVSKTLPYFLLALGIMSLCFMISVWGIGIPFRGNFSVLLMSTALFLFSALGMGLFISTLTKNQFNAAQAALFAAFLPAVMLSGFMYDIPNMPLILQWISSLIPASYFVTILQTLFQSGTLWAVILPNCAGLLALGLFWLGLAFVFTQKQLA